jgi:hypothetical protein
MCEEHGRQLETFACQHILGTLQAERAAGFSCSAEDESPKLDAWWSECEEHVSQTGGEWTDRNLDVKSAR